MSRKLNTPRADATGFLVFNSTGPGTSDLTLASRFSQERSPIETAVDVNDARVGIEALFSEDGATVKLPAGSTWNLTDAAITLPDGASLIGSDGKLPSIVAPDETVFCVTIASGANQKIRNIKLTQNVNTANVEGGMPGLLANNSYEDLLIEGMEITKVDAQAIQAFGTHLRTHVLNNRIFQAGRAGMVLQPAVDCIIRGNNISFTGDDGIAINGRSRNCLVTGNRLHAPGAVHLAPSLPTGNDGQGWGFKVHGQNVLISDNIVTLAYSGFVEIKPNNNADPEDPEDQPTNVFVCNNIFDGLATRQTEGKSKAFKCGGANTNRIIGHVQFASNYVNCAQADGTRSDHYISTIGTEKAQFIDQTVINARFLINCSTATTGIVEIRGGSYESSGPVWLDGQRIERLIIEDVDFTSSVAADPRTSLVELVTASEIGLLELKNVRLWGTYTHFIDVLQSSVIDTLVIQDCLIDGVPSQTIKTGSGGAITSINTKRPATAVANATAGSAAEINALRDALVEAGVILGS